MPISSLPRELERLSELERVLSKAVPIQGHLQKEVERAFEY